MNASETRVSKIKRQIIAEYRIILLSMRRYEFMNNWIKIRRSYVVLHAIIHVVL